MSDRKPGRPAGEKFRFPVVLWISEAEKLRLLGHAEQREMSVSKYLLALDAEYDKRDERMDAFIDRLSKLGGS